jgi:hypothetical protein
MFKTSIKLMLAVLASSLLDVSPRAIAATDWDAARDLKNNELLGSPQEQLNPNPSATNWIYGYRLESKVATTDLTLFTSAQHVHNGGNSPALQGWYRSTSDGPAIFANISSSPVVLNFCCGPLAPINTNDLGLWPASDGNAAVIRWVAPLTAKYTVDAYWRKTDNNGNGGCLSAVVQDGNVLYSQIWFNGDLPGYTNTITLTAGSVVDFLLGPDGDFSFDGTKFNATIKLAATGTLPPIGTASASPGFAPIRSNNPWTFTATYASSASDLTLRVQSTRTPNVEATWTDLPGNPRMTNVGADWTLATTNVPSGNRYFRVIAADPTYVDGISTVLGPFAVIAEDWDAAGDLKSNELLGSPDNLLNPNPTTTNWSYGYRLEADLATTNLTLFPDHTSAGAGSPELQGWYRASGNGASMIANVGASPVSLSFCCGPVGPINPGEMIVGPGADVTCSVARWIAPIAANYSITAYWHSIDPHGGNGAVGSIVRNGTVLFTQVWPDGGGASFTNTVAFAAGDVVDFVLGPNGEYSFDSTTFNATLHMQALGTLPAIGSVSVSSGVAPIRSSNPWTFSATYSAPIPGLRLRVQSTLTPNDEGSWTDLPGNPYMTNVNSNWILNTTDVPTGTRSFRVLASAPTYVDGASAVIGPFTVLEGIAPFGDFSWQTTAPFQPGVPWIFSIVEHSLAPGLSLRVQSSTTPNDPSTWNDLQGGGQMGRSGAAWTLNTTNVPTGAQSFRVVASAATYVDRISTAIGRFDIRAPLPIVPKTYSSSGKYSLMDIPEIQSPDEVFGIAVNKAVVDFGLPFVDFNPQKLAAALILAAQQYSVAVMRVLPNQTIVLPALNAGPGAMVELKGTIAGTASLIGQDGAGLIGQDGAGLIGQDGAGLTHDLDTARLIGQDGAGIVAQGAGNIVAQGAGNVVAQGSGNFLSPGAARPLRSRRITPQNQGPTQPAFTGLMTLNGNYNQFAGTLFIGIAGTNTTSQGAQQYDQLVVNGNATLLGGSITFGLFDPDDQTNRTAVFEPPNGATFDVIVASNIVAAHSFTVRGASVWGDGRFFNWGIVTRPDGLKALRLVTTPNPPVLTLSRTGAVFQLSYRTNYTGYTVQTTASLLPPDWTTFSTGTNVVTLSVTNANRYFRLSKP